MIIKKKNYRNLKKHFLAQLLDLILNFPEGAMPKRSIKLRLSLLERVPDSGGLRGKDIKVKQE